MNETKIDWKRKLSSRKFWAAVITFVTAVLVAFNVPDLTIEQVTCIIAAMGALIAYILSEGYVDAKAVSAENNEYGEYSEYDDGAAAIGYKTVAVENDEDGGTE